MIASQEIAPRLPLLRRYARAISGSAQTGDALVTAVLECVLADPAVLEGSGSVRAKLHRLLIRIVGAGPPSTLARQALLLQALEGFSAPDAAFILDVDAVGLAGLVEQAGHDLCREPSAHALIIHRDPLIALDLQGILESLGHHVAGVARTRAEAMKIAAVRQPDLIMTNTILADGSGIEVADELLRTNTAALVIVTGLPERFLTGSRPEPTFLIAAPFQPSAVAAIVSQGLFFARQVDAQPISGLR
jgi:CheY-like chemotaxis protein